MCTNAVATCANQQSVSSASTLQYWPSYWLNTERATDIIQGLVGYRKGYRYCPGTGEVQRDLQAMSKGWSGTEKATGIEQDWSGTEKAMGIVWGLVRYIEGYRH